MSRVVVAQSIVNPGTVSGGGTVWISSHECHFLSSLNLKIQSMNNKHMSTILKNMQSVYFTLWFKIKLPKVNFQLTKSVTSVCSLWNCSSSLLYILYSFLLLMQWKLFQENKLGTYASMAQLSSLLKVSQGWN